MAAKNEKNKPKCTAKVTFVPFKEDARRDRAYRDWVKLYIKGLISRKSSKERFEEKEKALDKRDGKKNNWICRRMNLKWAEKVTGRY